MYRWLVVGLLLVEVGCQNVQGPFTRTREQVDVPGLPIAEQKRRGREQLALPESDVYVGPRDAAARPGMSATR